MQAKARLLPRPGYSMLFEAATATGGCCPDQATGAILAVRRLLPDQVAGCRFG